MDTEQAFAALERLIKVAAQDQFSETLLQNARAGLDTLRNLSAQADAAKAFTVEFAEFFAKHPELQQDALAASFAALGALEYFASPIPEMEREKTLAGYVKEMLKLRKDAGEVVRQLQSEIEEWKRSAESYLNSWNDAVVCDFEPMRDDRDLWQRRANAQLEITRAAVAIVAAPFQIFDSTIGQRSYRISTQEFEDLQRAVTAYQKLAAQEAALAATPTE